MSIVMKPVGLTEVPDPVLELAGRLIGAVAVAVAGESLNQTVTPIRRAA